MTGMIAGARVVRGDVGRKLNNALTMTFSTGGEEPIAQCVQARAGGFVGKMGVLFGFKNGGSGFHEVVGIDGTTWVIESRELQSTIVRDPEGTTIAEAQRRPDATTGRTDPDGPRDHRAPASIVHLADGTVVFTVAPNPDGVSNSDIFQMVLIDPSGQRLATLDIIRRNAGWSLGQDLVDTFVGFGQAGGALPIPVVGSLVAFDREPTPTEGDLALVVCIDICVGLRPYIESMD